MNWLNGNIIWVLVAVAAVWFLLRGRGRGRGHGHGFGHGMGGGHHGSSRDERRDAPGGVLEPGDGDGPHAAAAAALDPVSGNPVRTDRALTAVFGGRAYHFESEETRKRFEAEPQRYATAAPPHEHRPRRRGGC